MANMTIANPGVGKLFSGLAGIFGGPDPNSLIQADMNRVRRDGMLVENDLNSAKLGTLQRQEQAMSQLATILGDPTLASTPEGRASLMSVLSQVPDGLQHGPGFATGAASFTDPNFVESDADFSRILAGTGVQGWNNTPAGQERELANKLEIARMGDQNDLAIAMLGGGSGSRTPLDVSPKDSNDLVVMLEDAIDAQFPGAGIDPQTMQMLVTRAASHYQTTRNAGLAVQRALADAKLQQGEGLGPGWLPWDWFRNEPGVVTAGETTGLGDVFAPPVEAPNLTPDTGEGAPPAPAEATTPPKLPAVHQNADGSTFLVHRGQTVTIVDGYQIRVGGQIYVWRDGQWNPA